MGHLLISFVSAHAAQITWPHGEQAFLAERAAPPSRAPNASLVDARIPGANATKRRRWFSREASLLDALRKAYDKQRCAFTPPRDTSTVRMLDRDAAEASVFGGDRRHSIQRLPGWASAVQDGARAAAAGLLRRNATRSPSRLRDYFAATWHCTGTEVSDTFVPCVYTRVSGCYEDRSFTCHTCTDD
jgi:hypothetical protein